MKYLKRFLLGLVYLLPATLYCSYYPIIRLGETSSMNLELSLPLIWLVLFDTLAFIYLIRITPRRRLPGITDRRFFLFSLFPFFATLSIFWSANPTRALLTAGIIWLVFFAIFALIYVLPLLKLPANFQRNCLCGLFISTIVICLVCWIQCFLDLAGLSRDTTLMCRGCTYLSFGFPHPSGLAIEPQFMGNLLLAPTLTALYLFIFQPNKKRNERQLLLIFACLFSATLFLTFSRGAIYAYAVALIVMIIFAFHRQSFRASLILIPCATFVFSVAAQGIFTVVGPTHGSFMDGVSRSIHQLSLGIIDFRPQSSPSSSIVENSEQPVDNSSNNVQNSEENSGENPTQTSNLTPIINESPAFDGYVAESTNTRLSLNTAALNTWLSQPNTLFFGVGLGGAGTAMYRNSSITHINSAKEIVQHQGISLLLELGLIGVALILLSFYLAFLSSAARHNFWHHPALPLLLALIIAYLITLNFFSGLPNALQIYLMPPLLYLVFRKTIALHANE